jgi:aerobic C4-dicarboxylate transport protein
MNGDSPEREVRRGELDLVVGSIPVAGMAIILGVDRFLSMCRATVNVISNGVATLVVARWDKELDAATLRANLAAVTGGSPAVNVAEPI